MLHEIYIYRHLSAGKRAANFIARVFMQNIRCFFERFETDLYEIG